MSFEQMVRVPRERVGVIIGKSGEEKKELEELLKVKLTVDSESGEVLVKADAVDLEEVDPFKAIEVIDAIGKKMVRSLPMELICNAPVFHMPYEASLLTAYLAHLTAIYQGF